MKPFRISHCLIPFFLTCLACSAIKTDDPRAAYKYWAGTDPPDDITILEGRYWESAHWSKEYILYLKLKPTASWWTAFVQQNQLTPDRAHWTKPADSPEWFSVYDQMDIYKHVDEFDDSRFAWNKATGTCYIYIIQL